MSDQLGCDDVITLPALDPDQIPAYRVITCELEAGHLNPWHRNTEANGPDLPPIQWKWGTSVDTPPPTTP